MCGTILSSYHAAIPILAPSQSPENLTYYALLIFPMQNVAAHPCYMAMNR